ncbi:MAG: tetratricopeptide repeat protein [Proteobacteria bacterium]|nr:tetratricopeptide repeat protein [Pseudomonadota bacterium]
MLDGRPASAQDDLYRKTLQEFSLERQQQNEAIQVQIASLRSELAQAPRDSRLPGVAATGRQHELTSKLRDLELQLDRVRTQLSDTEAAYEEQKLLVRELAAELSRAKSDVDPETYRRAIAALEAGDTNLAESLLQQVLEKRREQVKSAATAAYQLGRIKEVDRLDFRAAADLYKEAVRYDPENPTYLIAAAKNAYFLGQFSEAERLFEAAEQTTGIAPTQLAQILIGIAESYRTRGEYAKAEAACAKALTVLGPADGDAVMMSTANKYLGLIYWFQGRYAEADEKLSTAVQALAGREDKASLIARASALNSRAAVMAEIGDSAVAEPLYLEAVGIRKKLFPAVDRDPMAASYLNNTGLLYRYTRRFDEAHALFRQARAIFERAYGPRHPRVATAIANEAATLCLEGDHEAAWPLATQALEMREKIFGRASPVVSESIVVVGYLQRMRREPQAAEESYLRALEIRKKLPKTAYLDYTKTLTMLGNLYLESGRPKDAIAVQQHAIEVQEQLRLPSSPFVSAAVKHSLLSYAAALEADGQAAPAQEVERKAKAMAAGPVTDCAR